MRGTAAAVTTLTTLNPDSTADAVGFGNTAEAIARGLREGSPYLYTAHSIDLPQLLVPLITSDTYALWGTFLAPFWLLPGPSGFYARLGNALLGAFAVYNVYLIARYYHSHQAGVIAALPMTFYPSVVAVQTTLLREAIILFGITTAARLLMLPSRRRSRLPSYGLAGIVLHVSLLQRDDNVFIFVAAIAAALAVYAVRAGFLSRRSIALGASLSPVAFVLSLPLVRNGIEFLAYTREVRASGRTVYLPQIIPQTVIELIAFSWIGAMYFLYAPFPWMIETIPDLLVSIEGLINVAFTVAGIWGVRSLGKKNVPATVGLLVGLAVAVVLYGVGTVNYGTGMRHRQMFIWIVFLFGGIGISEHVRFAWPFQWRSDDTTDAGARTVDSGAD
ncbi:glycosyltransferase family 39 protein [Halorubrum ezzemoulense]|uniref:glycosyltransferase family 39 protein n=1 Tax=Halorubrum ezzemoulense TaxID=337243 RepID=UPI00232CFF35|nr:glycosyltransferase family 39 protein [Halorubrum ezzemoulense]MDB2262455.1 glycosyltransferase family 39 protein [Halorubrum ezzemoulense]MDB2269228.1 glycosyltransferase family 39 protein [Halorubrum ezzemoulense]